MSKKENGSWVSENYEKLCLVLGLAAMGGLIAGGLALSGNAAKAVADEAWKDAPANQPKPTKVDFTPLEELMVEMRGKSVLDPRRTVLLVSERRVRGVNSGYPIPYDADVCPYTGAEQPREDDLDLDLDGMRDIWELSYGLSPKDPDDAALDKDGDGFTSLEEFMAKTDPTDPKSVPPMIVKMRVAKIINTPFNFLFKAVSDFYGNGRDVYQLNLRAGGKTYFNELGDEIMDKDPLTGEKIPTGVVLKEFRQPDILVLQQGNKEIPLQKDKEVSSIEIKAELFNLATQETVAVRPGTVMELSDGNYTVDVVTREGDVVVISPAGDKIQLAPVN